MNEDPIWTYQCNKCGAIIRTSDHKLVPVPPAECYADQGGCGKTSTFNDVTDYFLRQEIIRLTAENRILKSGVRKTANKKNKVKRIERSLDRKSVV